jgi:hypothetical protein
MHADRVERCGEAGEPEPRIAPRGTGHVKRGEGYRLLYRPGHPRAHKNGQVYEHVLVMCAQLGRQLYQDETVHHINGIKNDNTPENLELWSTKHPKGQRVEDLVEWAMEILARYGSRKAAGG